MFKIKAFMSLMLTKCSKFNLNCLRFYFYALSRLNYKIGLIGLDKPERRFFVR